MTDDGTRDYEVEDVLMQDISMHLLDAIEGKSRSVAVAERPFIS